MSVVENARRALHRGVSPLVRALFPFGAERTVMRGPLSGVKYIVSPGMGATYAFGSDAYGARQWAKRIRPGMVVYDVGANCGQVALMFARFVGERGQVISFEPSPPNYDLLVRNLALNGMSARVKPHCLALAATSGRAEFLSSESPTQSKLRHVEPSYTPPEGKVIEIETVTMDEFVARSDAPPPDVIKIDVEGGAAEVLRGARDTLATHNPAVYIELHGPEERAGVRDHLQSAGYRLWRADEGGEVLDVITRWESPLWCVRGAG